MKPLVHDELLVEMAKLTEKVSELEKVGWVMEMECEPMVIKEYDQLIFFGLENGVFLF